ncbi:MAG: type II toxin-antitoxin system VapC family toxin [Candidatus Rokuibacteriota bacterium]
MIHLDTSFLIRALARETAEDRRLRRWVGEGEALAVSAVGWAEFLCGPVEAGHLELAGRILEAPVPFLDQDAALAARLFKLGGRRRGSLVDCMIAATALRAGATLATTNPADFRRFARAGLRLAW